MIDTFLSQSEKQSNLQGCQTNTYNEKSTLPIYQISVLIFTFNIKKKVFSKNNDPAEQGHYSLKGLKFLRKYNTKRNGQ